MEGESSQRHRTLNLAQFSLAGGLRKVLAMEEVFKAGLEREAASSGGELGREQTSGA